MGAIETIYIKQYDTIDIDCEYQSDAGEALTLEGVTVSADLQTTSGTTVMSFFVSMLAAASGKFNLTTDVTDLEVGSYRIDLLFTSTATGHRVSSETFNLVVRRAITQPR